MRNPYLNYGDMSPTLWFAPNTTRLEINAPVNGQANYGE